MFGIFNSPRQLEPRRKAEAFEINFDVADSSPTSVPHNDTFEHLIITDKRDRTYTIVSLTEESSFDDSLEVKTCGSSKREAPMDDHNPLFCLSPFKEVCEQRESRVKRFKPIENVLPLSPVNRSVSPYNLPLKNVGAMMFEVSPPVKSNRKTLKDRHRKFNFSTKKETNSAATKCQKEKTAQPVPLFEKSIIPQELQTVSPCTSKVRSPRGRSKVKMGHPESLHDKENLQSVQVFKAEVFAATIYGDPFMKSVLHSEDWLEKQELELINWLNSLLTPPKELECDATGLTDSDIVNLWERAAASGARSMLVTVPTKETVSISYHHQPERLRVLRKVAVGLINSESIVRVLTAVKKKIKNGILDVKDDIDIRLDQGVRRHLLSLLLHYNPLWLRIGLEAVYGQEIPLQSNKDIAGIVGFLKRNFLSSDEIVSRLGHLRSKLHLLRKAMNDYTVLKFFTLVFFLDQAKLKRIIPYDPCLFCKNSPIKDSETLVNEFIKHFLKCVGQMKKSLRTVGYELKYKQTYLHEMDFSVISRNDLRDGVRLARMMEIILKRFDLCSKLRVPAISKLQKIHNVGLTFNALKDAGYSIVWDITAKDIVEGHREKTMSLLWQILHKFIGPQYEASATIIQKWWRHKVFKVRLINKIKNKKQDIVIKTKAVNTIILFYKTYQQRKHFLLKKQAAIIIQAAWRGYRTRIAFRAIRKDYIVRKKAAVIIQECYRSYIVRRKFKRLKVATIKFQALWRGYKIRKEFNRNKKASIVIQSYFKSYIQRKKFLKLRQSTILVQSIWRRYIAQIHYSQIKEEHNKRLKAAIIIQANYKSYLQRKCFVQMKHAAVKIQSFWRGYIAQIHYNQMKVETHKRLKAALIIQSNYKAYLQRKYFIHMKNAVVKIQSYWKGHIARVHYAQMRQENVKRCNAVLIIQANYRAYLQRKHFVRMKYAAVKIQSFWRGHTARIHYSQMKEEHGKKLNAALIIQTNYKSYQQRRHFVQMKHAAVKIQSFWRGHTARIHYNQMKEEYDKTCKAILIIQAHFKFYLQRKRFLQMKFAAVKIQSFWKGHIARIRYAQIRQENSKRLNAALIIQANYRAYLQRKYFVQMKYAAVKIQSFWRGHAARIHYTQMKVEFGKRYKSALIIQTNYKAYLQRKCFVQMKYAAVKLQSFWRGYITRIHFSQMKEERVKRLNAAIIIQANYRACIQRKYFVQMKYAAVKIQSFWRGHAARIHYTQMKVEFGERYKSALIIQTNYKAYLQRKCFVQMKYAAVKLQSFWRGYITRIHFSQMKEEHVKRLNAALIIQTNYKAYLQRKYFVQMKHAAVKIQSFWRGYIARIQYVRMKVENHKRFMAAMIIQANYKSYLQRKLFVKMKYAAVKIQIFWRGYHRALFNVQDKCAKNNAAIMIQSNFKGLIQRKRFLRIKYSTIRIQSFWRGHCARTLVKRMKIEYNVSFTAATIIQSSWKGYLARCLYNQMKEEHNSKGIVATERKEFQVSQYVLETQICSITVKTSFEEPKRVAFLSRQTKAAIVIQSYVRRFLARKEYLRIVGAIRIIQNWWRQISSKEGSNESLRCKYRMALRRCRRCKTVRDIQIVFGILATVTGLSGILCRTLSKESEFHAHLWRILNSEVRSDPYIIIYGLGLNILLNLTRYESVIHVTWKNLQDNCGLTVLLILMSKFVKTHPELMCKACTVLWLFAHHKEYAQMMINDSQFKKNIYRLYVRLEKKPLESLTRKKMTSSCVSRCPSWGYQQSHKYYFDDPLEALDALVLKLEFE